MKKILLTIFFILVFGALFYLSLAKNPPAPQQMEEHSGLVAPPVQGLA